LEIRRRVLGAEHSDTLGTEFLLVDIYYREHRYAQAEKLGSELLEKRQRLLGPDNPDTLSTGVELAVGFGRQKHFAQAEKGLQDIIQKTSQIKDQSSVSGVWYNIACAEAVIGKSDLAIEHLKKANAVVPMSPVFVKTDEDTKSLHNDARFVAIVEDAKRRIAANSH
jgi:tetratricopeptide (TPR) repeat protein